MTLPGFTAEAALDHRHQHYRMRRSARRGGAGVSPAQLDLGDDGGFDLGIDPELAGTCAATTTCGPCQRFCINYPFRQCFAFRVCHCTTKGGKTKVFTRPC